jgi:hypothetical protein
MSRYRLRDDGYATIQLIMRGKDRVGRVIKNNDDSFTGIIGRVQVSGSSWEDAKNQVVATVEGIDVSQLTNEMVNITRAQEHTQILLTWLAGNAESNDGHLHYNNTDLAHAIGFPRPNQWSGNLVSRLDLCCCKARLPAIGLAAAAPFKNAWGRPGEKRVRHDWSFPIELMKRLAKSHHWTRDDFQRIGQESRALLTGTAWAAWDEYMAKHEGQIRAWAYQEELDTV